MPPGADDREQGPVRASSVAQAASEGKWWATAASAGRAAGVVELVVLVTLQPWLASHLPLWIDPVVVLVNVLAVAVFETLRREAKRRRAWSAATS